MRITNKDPESWFYDGVSQVKAGGREVLQWSGFGYKEEIKEEAIIEIIRKHV